MYVQRELADIWEKNILENLKTEKLEFKLGKEFLVEFKKKLGKDDKLENIAELKQTEQDSQTINRFVQIFKHIARYMKVRVEKFKKEINSTTKADKSKATSKRYQIVV